MKSRDSRIRAAGEDMPAALAQALHERDMAVDCINKALRAGEMLCSACAYDRTDECRPGDWCKTHARWRGQSWAETERE